MGLCKCPKKKVTNQFCFEHRVNVCEHCMVTNHPKCIVQSYLQWLQDSDYNPICEICKIKLDGDCIRLTCYHVFHWECLNRFATSLPAHTAPAGYTCPNCQAPIFPAANVVSPIAEALRTALNEVNWARPAFGLPLIDIPKEDSPVPLTSSTPNGNVKEVSTYQTTIHNDSTNFSTFTTASWSSVVESSNLRDSMSQINASFPTPTDVYSNVGPGHITSPRKLFDSNESSLLLNSSIDHDENKYKRRSAIEWLSRWFKSRASVRGRHDPHWRFKRYIIVAILVLLSFFTIIMIFMRLGRSVADDDPFLNPMANPQIRVNDNI